MMFAGSKMSSERPSRPPTDSQHRPLPLGCDYYRDHEGRLVQVLSDDVLLDIRALLREEPDPGDPVVAALVQELRLSATSD